MNRPFESVARVAPRRRFPRLLAALLWPALAGLGCAPAVGPEPGAPGSGGSGMTGSGGNGSGGASGSGGSSGAPCDAPNRVFKPSCAGAECHSAGSLNGVFAVDDPELSLIGREPAFSTGNDCSDEFFINPSAPLAGALFKRVMGTACGRRMPLSAADGNMNPPPPADYVECIRSWATSKLR